MDFSDITFWLSLVPALLVLVLGSYVFARHEEHRRLFNKLLMLAVSLLLLGLASWQTLIIFLLVSNAAYVVCRVEMAVPREDSPATRCRRKVILGVLIPLLLLPLLYYKYGYFIGAGVLQQEWDSMRDLIIPIGISFYTFQIIGFCIDTLMRGERMPTWMDYMNFCSYFPAIVAGPIERRSDLLPQVQKMELRYREQDMSEGIRYIILGLFFKMVMADCLAKGFWQNYTYSSAWVIWLNNLFFTFRIYFDFAGYGLTAYGLGRCMGITLRMNFMSPYTAGNISEFWRRWHTSLTLWFRDYIYFPMGGSRTKRWALNLVIVFLISGIWHGAGWNFIMWGGFAGVFMVIHRLFRKAGWQLPGLVGWGLTFGLMVFVWMFFYDSRPELLWQHLRLLFTPEAYGIQNAISQLMAGAWTLMYAAYFLPLSFLIVLLEYISARRTGHPYALFLNSGSCAVMVFLLVLCHSGVANQFIYFAF